MDRRDFLQTAALVPLAPKLGAGLTPECSGHWRGLPVGWARFTNWQVNAPRWPEISEHGYLWVSVADLLSARLTRLHMLHGLGYCSCVAHDRDVEHSVRDWWTGKETVSKIDGVAREWWPPTEVRFHDCETEWCECERGMFLHPDHWP
jgi:hypothetical protein